MATLDGSTTAVDLEPGYTLLAPGLVGSAEIRSGRAAQSRAGGLDNATPAFETALARADIRELRTISLDVRQQPAPAGARSLRTAGGEEALVLEVPDLGESVAQIVLAIDDGVLTWNFPDTGVDPLVPGATRGAGGKVRFVIRSQVPVTGDGAATGDRGLFGALGKKILKLLVYPVTDALLGPIGEHFARRWEEANRPYNLRRFTPADYKEPLAEPLSDAEWGHLGGGRNLLFVHGTFSTAHGGFGALPEASLQRLFDAYHGRVFAFDHMTLSASPQANAQWFNEMLRSRLAATQALDLDIVCHSRGGLVARILAGELGGAGQENIRVGKVVFVATPNEGTLLADPDHLVNFLDRYTSALDLVPPGPPGVIADVLEAILAVVKVLGHAGLTGLDGLATMDPRGRDIKRLNSGVGVAAQYYAIASNYTAPGNLGHFTLKRVGDKLIDRVFEDAHNDLVVPTDGVTRGSTAAGFPIPAARSLLYAAERGIWHSDFFAQPDTSKKLLNWLPGG